jgi:hypothetical protein
MKEVTAFVCDFCPRKKRFAVRGAAKRHESRCFYNPATRACATCANFNYVPDYHEHETGYCLEGVWIMSRMNLVGAWLTSLAHSLVPGAGRAFRFPRVRVPGGEGRKGHWDEPIGAPKDKFATMTRQRRRAEARRKAVADVQREFGGYSDRGGPFWSTDMPRRIARSIAFDRSKS